MANRVFAATVSRFTAHDSHDFYSHDSRLTILTISILTIHGSRFSRFYICFIFLIPFIFLIQKSMITYQPYEDKYKQQIIDLILDIQINEFQVPITAEDQPDLQMIASFYQVRNGNFWLALSAEQVVGTIALVDCGEGVACLRKMFIHKEFRSQYGIAQHLLDMLVAQCQSYNFDAIYLGTRAQLQAAIRFYERNGFEPILKQNLPAPFPIMAADTDFFVLKLR